MYAVLSNRLHIKYVSHGKEALFFHYIVRTALFWDKSSVFPLAHLRREHLPLEDFLFAITCRQYDPPQRIHWPLHRFHSVSFYFNIILFWKVICQGCFLHDISPYIKKPNKHAKISLNITSFANIIIEKPTNFCYTYFYN